MKQQQDTYGNVLKYTGLLGGVQVFNVLMAIVRNKFTAFFIGPWGMGLVVVYTKAAELMGNMTNFGISFSAVRRLAELHERGERRAIEQHVCLIRSWVLLTAIFGLLVCLLFAPVLSRNILGDYHTTRGFLLIAPMVPMLTLLGGELAILKGLRQLRRIAAVSALSAVVTMVVAVVVYWLLGTHGVIPVLLLTTFFTLVLNLRASTRDYPYRVALSNLRLMRRGGALLKLGSAFVLAGIMGSGADIIVTGFISQTASPHAVGLYGAGFTLIVSYARIVFVAMEADYFPRLSAAGTDTERLNAIINRQTDVLVLLMGPFLILFALLLPLIVPLLLTKEFLIIVPMVLCALSYMFFKAVYASAAYLPLARGDSLTYFLMELAYDAVFVGLLTLGYHTAGLVGAGIGLSLANLFDLVAITAVYRVRYGFRFAPSTLRRCALQYALLLGGLVAAYQTDLVAKIGLGLPILGLSLWLSWDLLRRETTIVERVKRKLNGKLGVES